MWLRISIAGVIAVFLLLGVYFGNNVIGTFQSTFYKPFFSEYLYASQDVPLREHFNSQKLISVSWESLIPEQNKQALEQYQMKSVEDFTQQVLKAMQASSDDAYRTALQSTQTVTRYNDQSISIPGFIVPIDFYQDKSLKDAFVVPYFGACIHFPPPPPNQMLFIRLEKGLVGLDFLQAYELHGVLRQGVYEDPLGTSAYQLDVVSLREYMAHPDDYRQHDIN